MFGDRRLENILGQREGGAEKRLARTWQSGRRVLGLLNGYFNLPLKFGRIGPYITAGIGFAYNDIEDVQTSDPANGSLQIPGGGNGYLTWNAGAGTVYPFNDWFDFSLAYRYLDTGHVETDPLSGFAFGVGGLRGDFGLTRSSSASTIIPDRLVRSNAGVDHETL